MKFPFFLFIGLLLFIVAVGAQEQQVCCSETVDGEFCQYTGQSNCKPGALQAATTCEQTSFCKLGCGFDQTEGACFKNTPKFTCDQRGNCQWLESPSCAIPQCQQGCCVLSNECSFTTQLECKKITSQFKDIEMTFKEEIDTELACINQCRSFERGACVSSDGSCRFTTRDSCPFDTPDTVNVTGALVGFHKDRLCSNPQLGTECAPQQSTGCVPDRDEVYWFDSCGNPENIYSSDKVQSYNNGFALSKDASCNPNGDNIGSETCGNCNFILGSLCARAPQGVDPTFGDFSCTDLSCRDLTVADDVPAVDDSTVMDNGESWCAYDSIVGFGKDTVGSRHYRRLCINGIELTEPCKDFREELCVQGEQGQSPFLTEESFRFAGQGFVQAGCRVNRWQNCNEINNKKDCENVQGRDCYWTGPDTRANGGVCLPTVPPGLKFWTDESTGKTPNVDAQSVCEKGNQQCTVVYEIKGIGLVGDKEKCIANCECESKNWLLSSNLMCKSLGDCGAYINFLGKGTTDGFDVSDNFEYGEITQQELDNFKTLVKLTKGHGDYDKQFNAFFKTSWIPLSYSAILGLGTMWWGGVGTGIGFLSGALSNVLYPQLFAFGEKYTIETAAIQAYGAAPAWQTLSTTQQNTLLAEALQKNSVDVAKTLTSVESQTMQKYLTGAGNIPDVLKPKLEALTQQTSQLYQQPSTQPVWGTGWSTFLQYVNTAMWIWTVYQLLDIILADQKEITYSISCQPWVAPLGGSDCEECQEEGKECSEYRCKSLGQLCKLVNAGTTNELCISAHPNDVVSPIISADPSVLTRGLTLIDKPTEGYLVSPDIEPFTAVTLGIKTNEPSQCKYSANHSVAFDRMTTFFGDNLYRYAHNLTFSMPAALLDQEILRVTNGGKFTMYVRCQDGNGNANEKDYYIKFAIKPGPDLTPPTIELTSIENGAFIPYGINQSLLSIYLNEPATCKWSDIDNDYDNMNHDFTCSTSRFPTSSLYYGLYDCSTILDPLHDNKENRFFFKCKDQPTLPDSDRNVNAESFVFTLQGTRPLEITSVTPLSGSELFTANPTLRVVTSKGAQAGGAVCGYNFFDPNPLSAIDFLVTNATVHEQPLTNLTAGSYTLYISCIDAGGNIIQTTTSFTVSVDAGGPRLAQVYTDGSLLIFITDEPSTCQYSTTGFFTFGEGVSLTGTNTERHEANLESELFYIVCRDEFSNDAQFTIYL